MFFFCKNVNQHNGIAVSKNGRNNVNGQKMWQQRIVRYRPYGISLNYDASRQVVMESGVTNVYL